MVPRVTLEQEERTLERAFDLLSEIRLALKMEQVGFLRQLKDAREATRELLEFLEAQTDEDPRP